MKIVIASDIHGSASFCESLIERYRLEGGEKLLLAGDILHGAPGAGSGAPRVCALLGELGEDICCVAGNCDRPEDAERLGFPLHEGYYSFDAGERRLVLTHGHIYNERRLPPLEKGDILVCGHSHVKEAKRLKNGAFLVNPGSLSRPRDGLRGSYAVYDGKCVLVKYLDGKTVLTLEL